MLMVALDRHLPGKRPCTESKRNRCALSRPAEIVDADHFDIGAAGLGDGAQQLRPMRPNPLMATRIIVAPTCDVVTPGKGIRSLR